MAVPILEFDFLIEMKVYMTEMIEEHTKEINALVKIKYHLRKTEKVAEIITTETRINKLKGLKNKAHNFVLFLNDYLECLKK